MPTIEKSKFKYIMSDLIDYGNLKHEEISFKYDYGQPIPQTTARPNWFFRFIRWLFGSEYKNLEACKKVVHFLDDNRLFLAGQASQVQLLKNKFSNAAKTTEQRSINTLFDNLFSALADDQKPRTEVLPDGTELKGIFEGEYLKNGTKTLSDGTFFEGEFKENKLIQGKIKATKEKVSMGSVLFASGGGTVILEGTFDDDELLIQGKKTDEENKCTCDGKFGGSSYTSIWNRDLLEGTLTITEEKEDSFLRKYVDTTIYKGKFKNNALIEGEKTIIYGNETKTITANGKFLSDSFLLNLGSMAQSAYTDAHLAGNGVKCIVESKGTTRLEGEFKNGGLIEGKKTFPDQTVQKGHFWCDIFCEGIMVLPNLTRMEGTFEKDKLHGRGKITYPNGGTETGNFYQGVLT